MRGKRERLSVYLPPALADWLKERADESGTPMSALINQLLYELKREEEKLTGKPRRRAPQQQTPEEVFA